MIKKRQIIILFIVLLVASSLPTNVEAGLGSWFKEKITDPIGNTIEGTLGGVLAAASGESVQDAWKKAWDDDGEEESSTTSPQSTPAPIIVSLKIFEGKVIEDNPAKGAIIKLDKLYEIVKITGRTCWKRGHTGGYYTFKFNFKRNDNIFDSFQPGRLAGGIAKTGKCADFEVPIDAKGSADEILVDYVEVGDTYSGIQNPLTLIAYVKEAKTYPRPEKYTFTGPIFIYLTKKNSANEFTRLGQVLKRPNDKPGLAKSSSVQASVNICDPSNSDCLLTEDKLKTNLQLWIIDNDPSFSFSNNAITEIKNFNNKGGGLFVVSKRDQLMSIQETIGGKIAYHSSWRAFSNDNFPEYLKDQVTGVEILGAVKDDSYLFTRDVAEYIEPSPYKNAFSCEKKLGKWTGNKCCQLSEKDNKNWYYNDPSGSLEGVELGGCWNNKFVATGTNPSEIITDAQGNKQTKTLKQVINVNGEFYYCKNLPEPFKQPSIEILFPKEGDNLRNGEKYRILWKSFGVDDNVKIFLGDYLIATVPNTGYYDWDPASVRGEVYDYYPARISISSGGIKTTSELFSTLSKTSSTQSTPSNINTLPSAQGVLSSFKLNSVPTCGKITAADKTYSCKYNGEFDTGITNKNYVDLFKRTTGWEINDALKAVQGNDKDSSEGCCPANKCFNGKEICASKDDLFEHPVTKEFFSCNPGQTPEWSKLILKSTPEDESVAGEKEYYCKSQSQCLLEPRSLSDATKLYDDDVSRINYVNKDERPHCVESGRFFEDRYCNNGDWTSRTKFLVNKLLNQVGNTDFELVCGKAGNILNEALDDNFGNLNSGLSTSNSACTLKVNDKVLFGTTLNTPINDKYKQSPLKAITSRDACDTVINSASQQFEKCTPTKPVKQNLKIFYYPNLNTIIFSPEDLAANNDDKFNALLKPDFDAVVSTTNSLPEEERERYKPIERTKYFETMFYLQKAGKRIFGFIEDKTEHIEKKAGRTNLPHYCKSGEYFDSCEYIFIGIKYTDLDKPLNKDYCEKTADKLSKLQNSVKDIKIECSPSNDGHSIFVLSRVEVDDEPQAEKVWKDLTQKLRLI